jgi:glycine cleavage system H protein
MNPTDRKYHPKHMWAKLDGDIATVGITEFAQKKLKNIVFIELPNTGDHAVQGQKIGTIESVKSVSEMISPVSGEIVETNDELLNSPEIINSQPYGKGWIARIRLSTREERKETEKLLSAEEYEKEVA